ncbi:Uncharacterised protein [Vibrio cholerae]|nr:Uncharacterised protein [Vibrio cholerae]CSI10194.1 Uncharacterised protein [Vibrio cholerae]CSI38757.1 Uncharacterised protein [Vibrio cholerae]
MFSSWRTLPGQSSLVRISTVRGLSVFISTPSSLAASAKKCLVSFSISCRRSRSDGIWMRITFRRWNKSSRNLP